MKLGSAAFRSSSRHSNTVLFPAPFSPMSTVMGRLSASSTYSMARTFLIRTEVILSKLTPPTQRAGTPAPKRERQRQRSASA